MAIYITVHVRKRAAGRDFDHPMITGVPSGGYVCHGVTVAEEWDKRPFPGRFSGIGELARSHKEGIWSPAKVPLGENGPSLPEPGSRRVWTSPCRCQTGGVADPHLNMDVPFPQRALALPIFLK